MNDYSRRSLHAIRDAAAEWVIRLGAPTVPGQDRAEFASWLRQSPVHLGEYLRAEAAWHALDAAVHRDGSDIETLLRAPDPNVIGLEPAAMACRDADAGGQTRFGPRGLAAAALVGVLLTGAVFVAQYFDRLNPNVYATQIGERRRLVLPDGSAVELNTRSRIKLKLSAQARDIQLLEGEAYFEAAPDPLRPFRVITDAGVVRAVGTQFNVYRKAHVTDVTVIEGRVAVSGAESAAAPREFGVGASVRLSADSVIPIDMSAPNAIAWRNNRLIFDDVTLATAVAEFNRYNRRQIVIRDPMLAGEHISGAFHADKPQGLIRFLEQDDKVRIDRSSPDVVILKRW